MPKRSEAPISVPPYLGTSVREIRQHRRRETKQELRLIPGDEPIHEGHVAVRFGDHYPNATWAVYLDGVDVSNDVNEAIAGEQGAVVMFCRDAAALEAWGPWVLVTGHVVVERRS